MSFDQHLSENFYLFMRWVSKQTFGRYYRLEVSGMNHWPSQGPVILCPKHQRWEDIPVVGMAFPRPLHYIAKVELFQQTWSRKILEALGGIPVDRQRPQATLSTFRSLQQILCGRGQIVLFPEGTYFKGKTGPGKYRLIQMLLRLQKRLGWATLPFLPLGISYQPASPGYRVQVRLGPPLSAPGVQQAQELTDNLMAEIDRLSSYHAG
jgi:1-acyl-sn-glycerol-3-phosphate acyltransferase